MIIETEVEKRIEILIRDRNIVFDFIKIKHNQIELVKLR